MPAESLAEEALPSTTPSGPEVVLIAAPTLSYAMEQSGVPLVRAVSLHNPGPEPLRGGELHLELSPSLGAAQTFGVPELLPGESTELGLVDYRLAPGQLRQVTEAERARLLWSIQKDGALLTSGGADVEVLPFNHWPGLRAPPALLASFVTPNHAVVAQLLRRTAEKLGKALTGYQSHDPAQVRAQVEALFAVIQSLGLAYVGSPASFEQTGQKVRLPDQLLAEQLGCCLDLSVLFASCLEQMGLAPLLVIVQGHAFPAVWLIDDRFPEGLIEDAARLRNQLALGQLLTFEATLAAGDQAAPFAAAEASASKRLVDDERFVFALDLRACRSEFKPLPLRTVTVGLDEEGAAPTSPQRVEVVHILRSAQAEPQEAPPPPAVPEDVAARFRRWKDALLDLSLRNKLLNFNPEKKGTVALEVPDLPTFEDLLAAGQPLEIVGRPQLHGVDRRDERLARARLDEADHALRLRDLAKHVLHTSLSEDRLTPVAKELIRDARTDLEEGGVSTLYAVLGVLKWLEPGTQKERRSPLILYPVSLELERARGRVTLRRLPDEEPVANVTLIEKLRRDVGVDLQSLGELATDEAGLDVTGLLKDVRRAIQSKPGFEVLEDAYVARFSFAKFLMWKDLEDNAPVLLESPVVRHIAGASATWVDIERPMSPDRLDDEVPSHALPAVLDADSTQLSAVVSALRGRSFVLQGPPGTGKSQTITNLIAAALADGKRTLFVSEKMAALEVVHRRLQQVGLGDFCLELHSNKTNKKDVLRSLGAALDRPVAERAQDWEARSAQLDAMRGKLNAYAAALHTPRSPGFTLFQAAARLRELDAAPDLRIPLADPLHLTQEQVDALRHAASDFAARAQRVEPLDAHPWRHATCASWTLQGEERLFDALTQTGEGLTQVDRATQAVEATLGVRAPRCLGALEQLAALAEAAASGELPSSALEPTWPERAAHSRAWLDEDARRARDEAALFERWRPNLLEHPIDPLVLRFTRWAGAFFLFAWLFLFSARRELRALCRGPLPKDTAIRDDLQATQTLRGVRERLSSARASLAPLLDADLLRRGDVLRSATLLPKDDLRALAQRSPSLSADRRALLRTQAATLRAALDALSTSELQVRTLAGFPPGSAWPLGDEGSQLEVLRTSVTSLLGARRSFRDLCLYREAAAVLETKGQGALVEAHAQGQLFAREVPDAQERTLLSRWLAAVTDEEEALRSFDARGQERQIDAFTALDREQQARSREYVTARLEQRLHAAPRAPKEEALLRRELQKKMRHLATRRLLQSLPTLLPHLKPCFLMSPLSVAQYLPADARFDLVIFDEASQIGTHDAVGAISRGSQVVVVGDSKQLPPTTFFKRAADDEDAPEDENDVAELESVLDEALAKGLPQQMLGWHYRSRHDALIAFSNHHYYDDRLSVFPAARQRVEDLGVKWHPVPGGCFLSGGDRTNPKEAEQLVQHLVEQLSRYRPSERTFGVVTFGLPQRHLIEELLDGARARHPELEPHFSGAEPVFVKNLENVQGDERDEIYFSIGYAKDERGRLRMHFGPLSSAGGERRLNVAITRARSQLRVFSTLCAEDIDLARTKARGTAHLRSFLEFASRGAASRPDASVPSFESAFDREVHEVLTRAGHRVRTAVGCAGYRVSLGVERPGQPGVFALGVELDGPGWAAAHSARDRERLRWQVLEALGWKMHRIWSTEWSRDPEGEAGRLLEAVHGAISTTPAV